MKNKACKIRIFRNMYFKRSANMKARCGGNFLPKECYLNSFDFFELQCQGLNANDG